MAVKTGSFFFFLQMALVLSLMFTITMASASETLGDEKATGPTCNAVYGVETGDTCFTITQAFHLTEPFFSGANPNLNCDALFVGQWLYVGGSPN